LKITYLLMKKNISYLLIFLITLAVSLQVHLNALPEYKYFLFQSYAINAVLALVALLLLGYGMQKKKNNLSLMYLTTVALKLAVYFLFFHPQFQLDGMLSRKEFFVFFIPYAIGLFSEVVLLARRF